MSVTRDYIDGYQNGYKTGFDAGYEKGKREGQTSPYVAPYPQQQYPDSKGINCKVCGMFFEHGKVYGYCCMNSNCPSKVSCVSATTTTANVGNYPPTTQWSSWMSGRPTK